MSGHGFFTRGWCHFGYDTVLAQWAAAVLAQARAAVVAPENAGWLRCGGTWFAGVNALPNDASGATADCPPIAGKAVNFIRGILGLSELDWDRAQVSVVYPGYPQPMTSESAAAFRYRRDRDAAHLDGLLRDGPQKRRYLREHHAFIFGIPLVETSADAAPLVVWEGSHEVIRRVLQNRFRGIAPEAWHAIDLTELYQRTRREIFASCRRVTVAARPGEAYLVHRLALHGIAPWPKAVSAPPDGRMIIYFRPDTGNPVRWLHAP